MVVYDKTRFCRCYGEVKPVDFAPAMKSGYARMCRFKGEDVQCTVDGRCASPPYFIPNEDTRACIEDFEQGLRDVHLIGKDQVLAQVARGVLYFRVQEANKSVGSLDKAIAEKHAMGSAGLVGLRAKALSQAPSSALARTSKAPRRIIREDG